jgi:DNA-binding MarR family transcriptional regulator
MVAAAQPPVSTGCARTGRATANAAAGIVNDDRHSRSSNQKLGQGMSHGQGQGQSQGQGQGQSLGLSLEQFLPHRLNVLSSLVSTALSRVYAERYKIGIPEWRVVVMLGEHGELTGKAVGAYSHMHKTKVSRAVAQLEKRKLVTRRANRQDMREAFLSLTPAGRSIYEDVAPVALQFGKDLMDVVDPADRAALDRALHRLTLRSAALVAELVNKNERE